MIQLDQDWKIWIRDQGIAIVILCGVLYGAYQAFERQRESHERQIMAISGAIVTRLDRLDESYNGIDKRLGVMAVDLEFINGRSQRTLRRVKDISEVGLTAQ